MDLNPDKNIYIGKLKELVNAYQDPDLGAGLNEIVYGLDLNSDEILALDKYFVTPKELDFSSVTEDERESLQSLLFKYFRVDMKSRVEINRQNRWLRKRD